MVGLFGNEGGHQQTERGQADYQQGDKGADPEHENQCTQDGKHPAEQLSKAQQKAVRQLVHIRNHPADDTAHAVGVQVAEGHDLDFIHGLVPQVTAYMVGDLVIAPVHEPLGHCRNQDGNRHLEKDSHKGLEIHLARPQNTVHPLAGKDRQVKASRHHHRSQNQAEQKLELIHQHPVQHLPEGVIPFLRREFFLSHFSFPPLPEA